MQQELNSPLLSNPKSDVELSEVQDDSDPNQRIFTAKSPSRWKQLQKLIVSGISKMGLLYTTLVSQQAQIVAIGTNHCRLASF